MNFEYITNNVLKHQCSCRGCTCSSVTEVGVVQRSILALKVAKTDIGKQGPTAGALRTILSAISGKTRKRTVLEIVK